MEVEMEIASLKHATYVAFITSITFWLLFQLSKISAISNISPFAEDPYDAVPSLAFQIAVAIGLLSLARLVSIKDENGLRQRAPFILRGILLVELAVLIALVTDFIAIAQAWPLTISTPMMFLLGGLSLLTALFIITSILLAKAWTEFRNLPIEPSQNALGETIRDCWTLVTVIAMWFVAHLPFLKPIWNRIDALAHKIANTWNQRLPFANPDIHPWQFAMTFSVIVGIIIMSVIMISETIWEGSFAGPMIAILIAGIAFSVEISATLLTFLFFGSYLGLRPKLR